MSIDDAIRVMSLDDAKAQISKMKYALVYQISEVIFDRMEPDSRDLLGGMFRRIFL